VVANDGKSHDVQLYYDNTGELCVNTVGEEIVWERNTSLNFGYMKMGTSAQNYFGVVRFCYDIILEILSQHCITYCFQTGDRVGIDWGYVYTATVVDPTLHQVIYSSATVRVQFVNTGTIPSADDTNMPRPVDQNWPVMATMWDLGTIPAGTTVSKYLIFAYDDVYSINYFGNWMTPYWSRNGATACKIRYNFTYSSSEYDWIC
jgi:hypothetical protein